MNKVFGVRVIGTRPLKAGQIRLTQILVPSLAHSLAGQRGSNLHVRLDQD